MLKTEPTILEWLLFKSGCNSRVAVIQERRLLEIMIDDYG